tara:strand:+ start:294 stop:3371 length:3078 start_codon:yes stop_codon:yes gene_type:complete
MEMNMHMPQNVLAETELRHLAAIPYQIISPGSSSPIVGIFQDSLLGSYRFTRPNVKFTQREAMNLLMCYKYVNTKALREGPKISSFDILSQIMSPLTLQYKNGLFEDGEDFNTSNNVLEVRNGKYIRGQIDKSVVMSGTKGILHRSFNDFGNMACSDFIDNLQNIVTEYMKTSAYSVGISDLVADDTTKQRVVQAITKQKMEVQSIIEKVHLGVFDNKTSKTNKEEFEMQVNQILDKAMNESGKVARNSLSKDNRFLMIVKSGSKGSMTNITQMITGLGQQNVDGRRIPYGFDNRTLPHYNKFDDGPSARGFVENSYISGLTAPELFFHAMGGRVGLIDTAVKTSQTGYIQRRLIKGLEDLKVEYDMTVRNNKGKIVEFSYGDDNMDTCRLENQFVKLVSMSIEDIYMHYDIPGLQDKDKNLLSIYEESTLKRLKKERTVTKDKCKKYIDYMIENRNELVEKVFRKRDDNRIKLPVSLTHIIANVQGQMNLNANSIVNITPNEAFEIIDKYYEKLTKYMGVKPSKLFEIMYYFHLSPKDLLVVKRFHKDALIMVLENILRKYKSSIVQPGEMVGIIAGQSIGEPATQMTLNTFHHAGVGSKSNVTRGVPRIEELLRLTKNPKNPSLTIHLKDHEEDNKDRANKYAKMIEFTKLYDLVKSIQIYFDPNERSTFIEDDKILLEQYYEYEDMVKECSQIHEEKPEYSKWITRIEIDQEVLLYKNITMDDINFAIKHSPFGGKIQCIYSDYNSEKLVFRIRSLSNVNSKKKSLDQSDEIYMIKDFQDALLNNIVLRGINHIKNVMPRKLPNMVCLQDGKYVKKDVYVLDTVGTNMIDAMALSYIDSNRTYSNDVREICNVLGMEAARQVLFNEFLEVMSFAGLSVNYHHLNLLCNRMTMNKEMTPIFRSGILNDDIGPIAKATFEVQTEVLLTASRHADIDHMRGVSSNVMCGQYGNYGTGAFNVLLDMNQMKTLSEFTESKSKSIDEMFDLKADTLECDRANIEIKNNLFNIKTTNANVCDDDYNMGF